MAIRDLDGIRSVVLVCVGSSCRHAGASIVLDELKHSQKALGLKDDVHIVRTRCLSRCEDSCNVVVMPDNAWYCQVTPKLARRITREHLRDGTPVEGRVRYAARDGRLRRVSQSGKTSQRESDT